MTKLNRWISTTEKGATVASYIKKLHETFIDNLADVVLIHVQTCVDRLQISHFDWSTTNEIDSILVEPAAVKRKLDNK